MANHKKFDAVATVGEYKDRNGETKKRYVNIGSVFESDDGRLSLKLDSVPVGPEWSGWVSFYEPKGRDVQPSAPQQSAPPQRDQYAATADSQDDIPF